MATFEIDAEKVHGLTTEIMHVLNNRRVHLPDIIIALTEVAGRVIAAQDISPLAMREVATVAAEHLERTIRIGVRAKGGNMGDE
jgi:hypothetical protein